jgi:hypothetical protein
MKSNILFFAFALFLTVVFSGCVAGGDDDNADGGNDDSTPVDDDSAADDDSLPDDDTLPADDDDDDGEDDVQPGDDETTIEDDAEGDDDDDASNASDDATADDDDNDIVNDDDTSSVEFSCTMTGEGRDMSPAECIMQCHEDENYCDRYDLGLLINDCVINSAPDPWEPENGGYRKSLCMQCIDQFNDCLVYNGVCFEDIFVEPPLSNMCCAVLMCDDAFYSCFGFYIPWEDEHYGMPDPRLPVEEGAEDYCADIRQRINGDDDSTSQVDDDTTTSIDDDSTVIDDDASIPADDDTTANRECENEYDCALLGGLPRCERVTGTCVECVQDLDCDPGKICQSNVCIDEPWTGECDPPCMSHEKCVDGFCVLNSIGNDGDECASNSDCNTGLICTGVIFPMCRETCSDSKPCANANYTCQGFPQHCE